MKFTSQVVQKLFNKWHPGFIPKYHCWMLNDFGGGVDVAYQLKKCNNNFKNIEITSKGLRWYMQNDPISPKFITISLIY